MLKPRARASALSLTMLCCSLSTNCSPDDGPSEEVQQFGAEEDIKVELYIVALASPGPSESGDFALYEVSVNEPPTSPMLLTFQSEDEGEILSNNVFITPDNWSVPQQVDFVGVDDFLADGDQDVRITPTLQTLDARYAALMLEDIELVNRDNDAASTGISTTGMTSGGGNGGGPGGNGNGGNTPPTPGSPTAPYLTFESGELTLISLSSGTPHAEPIQIEVSLDDDTEAVIISIDHADDASRAPDGPSSFTLDPQQWPDEWVLSVRGLDDAIADGDIPHTLTLSITDPSSPSPITQQVHLLSIDGVCGNGVIEGAEGCDDGNTEVDACLYGEECCNVCGPRCFIVEGTPGGLCGDGIVQEGEACDPMAPDVCKMAPFTGGTSTCKENCQLLDTSGCSMDSPPEIHAGEGFVCALFDGGELRCAGADDNNKNATPPLTSNVRAIALESHGGCLIDEPLQHTKCWGALGALSTFEDTQRALALALVPDKLCLVHTAGSVICHGSGAPFKIIATGIANNSRPKDVALDDEGTQNCILFDDQSVTCAFDHLADPYKLQPFETNVEVKEIAMSGRFACALGDNNFLHCWDGEGGKLFYKDVRAFHLDEQLCITYTNNTLSCLDASPDFYADFDPQFYGFDASTDILDVSFQLENYGSITLGSFCVLHDNREIECRGNWTMKDTLINIPSRPRDVRVEVSWNGAYIQDEFGNWRGHGTRFVKSLEGRLAQVAHIPKQGLAITGGQACYISALGQIECIHIPASSIPYNDPPYSRIITSNDGSPRMCAVGASRRLECSEHFADPTYFEADFDALFSGASHPVVSRVHEAICAGGPNRQTVCTGTAPLLAEPAPNFLEAISISQNVGCGLRLGQIECWGAAMAQPPPAGTYREIVVSDLLACAIDEQRGVTCWRPSFPNFPDLPLFDGTGYSGLSVSDNHVCAIHDSGHVVCQGDFKQEKP